MKKELLLSFLAGLVLPLAFAAFFQRIPGAADVESEGLSSNAGAVGTDSAVMLTIENRAGNLQQISLEEYLVGVVLAEMPADFDREALKAQAVVARTYTRKRMDQSKHDPAAVCTDSGCCQGYRSPETYLREGGTKKSVEKVRAAVTATDGAVLCYEGSLIDATYFSCSGGSTEDALAVWGQDVPYLQAVDSPGEEAAPRYTDRVEFTVGEFADRLGLDDGGNPSSWVTDVRYTDGGGVETIIICGKSFTGTQLRSKLGLRSTAFQMEISGNTVAVTTRGFGHRVGMSQYGAQAMAKAGSGFEEILRHYYTGAEVVWERRDGN